jgi:glycosyltransferase involved in cell wall biosynthesis
MNKNSLVSCIIIFLNAQENFFIEAIESIFAQTYSNWELLLVDDGSSNESSGIAKAYSQQYPEKVIYLEHEAHQNLGMSAARNLGINKASGEYIAFLDADDIWLPEKLEKQVTILENYPQAGMVYGSTLIWYSWNNNPGEIQQDRRSKLGVKSDTLVSQPKMIPLFLNHQAETPGTCSVLIRSQLVREVGGFNESFRGMYEDQVFFYKICLRAPVYVESGCWDKYRQHHDSACHIATEKEFYDPDGGPSLAYVNFLLWVEQYFVQEQIQNLVIWWELHKELWMNQYPFLFAFINLINRIKLITLIKRMLKLTANNMIFKQFSS